MHNSWLHQIIPGSQVSEMSLGHFEDQWASQYTVKKHQGSER